MLYFNHGVDPHSPGCRAGKLQSSTFHIETAARSPLRDRCCNSRDNKTCFLMSSSPSRVTRQITEGSMGTEGSIAIMLPADLCQDLAHFSHWPQLSQSHLPAPISPRQVWEFPDELSSPATLAYCQCDQRKFGRHLPLSLSI